jgi:hypothetical protein
MSFTLASYTVIKFPFNYESNNLMLQSFYFMVPLLIDEEANRTESNNQYFKL